MACAVSQIRAAEEEGATATARRGEKGVVARGEGRRLRDSNRPLLFKLGRVTQRKPIEPALPGIPNAGCLAAFSLADTKTNAAQAG